MAALSIAAVEQHVSASGASVPSLTDPLVVSTLAEHRSTIDGVFTEFSEMRLDNVLVMRESDLVDVLVRFGLIASEKLEMRDASSVLRDMGAAELTVDNFDECLLRIACAMGDNAARHGSPTLSPAHLRLDELCRALRSRNIPLEQDPLLGGGARALAQPLTTHPADCRASGPSAPQSCSALSHRLPAEDDNPSLVRRSIHQLALTTILTGPPTH